MHILVADVERGQQELCKILAEHSLFLANSIVQAQSMLAQNRLDALITSVHFDESRMYELLRYVRSNRAYDYLPFIVFQWPFLPLKGTTRTCVRESLRMLGASAFIDLVEYQGQADIEATLQKQIENLIMSGPSGEGSFSFSRPHPST